jgi:hypothetical protein
MVVRAERTEEREDGEQTESQRPRLGAFLLAPGIQTTRASSLAACFLPRNSLLSTAMLSP